MNEMFSKKIYARALKNKSANVVSNAIESIIIENNLKIKTLHTDAGSEYISKITQEMFKKYGIKHYKTYSINKAFVSERSIRTIKDYLTKYLYMRNTKRWVPLLPDIIERINSRPNRGLLNLAPNDINKENEKEIYEKLYKAKNLKFCEKPLFDVFDVVRVHLDRKTFEKSHNRSYSYEVYIIRRIVEHSYPCAYQLITVDNEPVLGRIYESELTRVNRCELFIMEKEIDSDGDKVKVQLKGLKKPVWVNRGDITAVHFNAND